MIKTGIIGFGLSSRYLQAPFLMSNPNFDLKTISTSQRLPLPEFQGVIGAKSSDELINNPDLDLISICSPNSTHYDLAKKALLSGKHVLVEKPLTPTALEAKELYQIAKEKGLVLAVYHNRRFDSDFLTLKKLINSDVLGDIFSYSAHYNRYKPDLNSKAWKETASVGSGILYDLGSHLIDQVISLFGKPEGVKGKAFTERENSVIDDAFDLDLTYPSLSVHLTSSLMHQEESPRYIIKGTKGTFTKYGIDPQEDQLKAGISPEDQVFGQESSKIAGILKVNDQAEEIIESCKGNWNQLFNSLAESINLKKDFMVSEADIVSQLDIITRIKNL